jgi:lipopolysaccharide transport system permease protein
MSDATRAATRRRDLRLLWHLVRQDFVDRYAGSALGATWMLIVPLMQILVFTLVFGKLIGPRIPGSDSVYAYGLYLVSGILPWAAFANTVGRTASVFVDKAGLLGKVPVSLWQVAVHVAIAEALTLVAVLGLFLVLMLVLFGAPPPQVGYAPLLLVFQQVLAFTLGLGAAILTVFLRDVKEFVGVAIFLWFWMTPIVYLVRDVPEIMQTAQTLNPAFWFIEAWHQVLVYGQTPDVADLAAKLAVTAAIAAGLLHLLSRWEREIRDFL